MCAISGAYALNKENKVSAATFAKILGRASERGRDSVGVYADGKLWKTITKDAPELTEDARVFLSNNRAEPTTEWVKDKTTDDVQPYIADGIVVVHNGTIANDKDIASDVLGIPKPNIDTKVIAPLLAAKWDRTLEGLVDVLNEYVVGSYAFEIYDEHNDALYLASNYKPLYTQYCDDVFYFSSLDKFLPGFGNLKSAIHKIPPYSVVKVDSKGITQKSLNATPLNKKALVVASGGLDSTVVAQKMVNDGYDVTLLHIKYKARAEKNEVEAINKIAERLNVPVLFVETDVFKNVIKASRLTETYEGTEIAEGEAGAELAYEWVPARNTIMLSIATGIAEARGIETIALGNNLEESGAYPDNEQELIYQYNRMIPNVINLGKRLQIIEPVGNLMKHEIVALGIQEKAPLDVTWSCYNQANLPCGHCGPCFMRMNGFRMNGYIDPQETETVPEEGFWDGCKPVDAL